MSVRIAELHELDELERAAGLVRAVWGATLASVGDLRAHSHAGNPILGAYQGDRLVGTSIAFVGLRPGLHLHSHITCVEPGREHAGIGLELKRAQRTWCLDNAVPVVVWTFDPMISRNAYFNFTKLGATSDELLVNFYGAMNDAINRGDQTDRLLVTWRVSSSRVEMALSGRPPAPERPAAVVRIPLDYEEMRRSDLDAALELRVAVRESLAAHIRDGLEISGFSRDGSYLFSEPSSPSA